MRQKYTISVNPPNICGAFCCVSMYKNDCRPQGSPAVLATSCIRLCAHAHDIAPSVFVGEHTETCEMPFGSHHAAADAVVRAAPRKTAVAVVYEGALIHPVGVVVVEVVHHPVVETDKHHRGIFVLEFALRGLETLNISHTQPGTPLISTQESPLGEEVNHPALLQ